MSTRAYAGTAVRKSPSTRTSARRRPARRRPAARRGPSRVRWDRLGRVALTLVLGAILVSYLNPVVSFIHLYRGSTETRAHLHSLLAENKSLHARVQATDDPVVMERAARRQGLIKPGERAYVVHGLSH
jgi:cell division protein FtsB